MKELEQLKKENRRLRYELKLSKALATWLDQLADYLRDQVTTGREYDDDDEVKDDSILYEEYQEEVKQIKERYKDISL